eukprot:jgi/Mesvir1/4866/Mv11139-RA.1
MAGQAKDADLGAMDYVHKIMGYVTGAVALNMARTALELGVFDALSACYGPASAEAIASKLDPPANARLVKELLLGLSASNIIACRDFKAGLFEHTDASRMCWTNEASSPMFLGGLPDMVVELAQREVHAKQLASFRRIDNPGLSYNDQGDGVAKAIGRLLGPWIRSLLVPTLRELLPEIITQLEAGAVVGDIGCGTCVTLRTLAKAFPKSSFHGFDNSKAALRTAAEQIKAEGLAHRITLHDVGEGDVMQEGAVDLFVTSDCWHDMCNPSANLKLVRRALKPGGVLFMQEPKAFDTIQDTMADPLAAIKFGFSSAVCLHSSILRQPDGSPGEAVGTCGWTPSKGTASLQAAGFKDIVWIPGTKYHSMLNNFILAKAG